MQPRGLLGQLADLPGREGESPPQDAPIYRLCWDELFNFIKKVLATKPMRVWAILGNIDASVVTEYTVVFTTTIPEGFQGLLEHISLYSSRGDATQWQLETPAGEQFTDKKIYAAHTFSFEGVPIRTLQKITVRAKTDGVATNIAASLTGKLFYISEG